jgi:hypothetical protein
VDEYISQLEKNIYTCMEMSKQSYDDVIEMPVQRFYNYLKWKSDLEEEKKKMLAEEILSGLGKK